MNPGLSDGARPLALRPAVPADAPALARLWRDAWHSANPDAAAVAPLPHWLGRVHAEFGPPCTALLAEHGDGAFRAFMVLDLSHRHLHQLFVAPGAQSQGLGRAMVREICQRLCPAGWTLEPVQDLFGDRIGVQSG